MCTVYRTQKNASFIASEENRHPKTMGRGAKNGNENDEQRVSK